MISCNKGFTYHTLLCLYHQETAFCNSKFNGKLITFFLHKLHQHNDWWQFLFLPEFLKMWTFILFQMFSYSLDKGTWLQYHTYPLNRVRLRVNTRPLCIYIKFRRKLQPRKMGNNIILSSLATAKFVFSYSIQKINFNYWIFTSRF